MTYDYMPGTQLGSLLDQLKSAGQAILKGTSVTVPTPAGPFKVDLGDPASVARARAAVAGTQISTSVASRPATSPMQQVDQQVQQNVPGGWVTVIGVGLLVAFVLPKVLKGSRS